MSTTILHHTPAARTALLQGFEEGTNSSSVFKHDVETTLNYFKDNEDGSAPHATYVDRPETYDRPVAEHTVTIRDISGDESKYTLDKNGFQIHGHSSAEKEFLNDHQIQSVYYAETEKLLKDV